MTDCKETARSAGTTCVHLWTTATDRVTRSAAESPGEGMLSRCREIRTTGRERVDPQPGLAVADGARRRSPVRPRGRAHLHPRARTRAGNGLAPGRRPQPRAVEREPGADDRP